MRDTPPDSPRHAAILLRQSLSQLNRGLRGAAPLAPATPAMLSVLGWLMRRGELTPSELAGLEGVRLQTLTRLLAALERAAWVVRRIDPEDARRSRLRLTAAGARLLTAHVRRREASLERAIAATLDSDEQRCLRQACALLERIAGQLQAGRRAAAGTA